MKNVTHSSYIHSIANI